MRIHTVVAVVGMVALPAAAVAKGAGVAAVSMPSDSTVRGNWIQIGSGGKIGVAKFPGGGAAATRNAQIWPMQPLLPWGAIRAATCSGPGAKMMHPPVVIVSPQMKNGSGPGAKMMHPPGISDALPKDRVGAYSPDCYRVNTKNFPIATVPVNPNIDSMGGPARDYAGGPWVVLPEQPSPQLNFKVRLKGKEYHFQFKPSPGNLATAPMPPGRKFTTMVKGKKYHIRP